MFNNIIYFILVLLIFNINYPGNAHNGSPILSLSMLFLAWLVFAGYCRFGFWGLQKRLSRRTGDDGRLIGEYQRLVSKFSVLAIILFALGVYLFELKYWLQMIPGFGLFSVLQGISALFLFFFYLSTIWYFAYPAYQAIFQSGITRRSYIQSNFRLNLPILFPWVVFSFAYDLIALSPLSGPDGLLRGAGGQIIFFAGFLILLMVFMPRLIPYWWGCKPVDTSEKGRQLEAFLRQKGFRYRQLLTWPIFEGRMMTAGIMGIVPRYRYILVTDSLLEVLSTEELEAVLAHEMGHAKYRHLLLYVLFFVGFMVLSLGLFDVFFYLLYAHPFIMKMIPDVDSQATNLFYLILSVPMLLIVFVYFRYVMGFFMRNFERQADLYSAVMMETARPIITSLEKIALFSGKSRDLPSWHHFSIRERVEYLLRALRDPGLIRRHNRFVAVTFLVYLVCLGSLGYLLNFSPAKQRLTYSLVARVVEEQLEKKPDNVALNQNLAMVYHHMGKYQEVIHIYEKIIDLDPNQATTINNLAWLLVTAPHEEQRDEVRALELAKRAVLLQRSPVFLDTLAEAYYANGLVLEAVKAIEDAIVLATEDREYYKKQLKRFSE